MILMSDEIAAGGGKEEERTDAAETEKMGTEEDKEKEEVRERMERMEIDG
jgi:hypothetical protein